MELVRRHLWMSSGGFSMSRRDSDSEKVPAALYDRLTDTPTYAARMYKVQLERWGLEYKFTMVWQKEGGVQPTGSCQHDVEFIVAGARGEPRFTKDWSFSSVITAPCADPLAGHSVKPKKFYDLVSGFTPGPRLELPQDGVRHWPVWEDGRV